MLDSFYNMAEPKVWQIDALAATLLALRPVAVESLLVNARLYIRVLRGDWAEGQDYINTLREHGVRGLVELLHSTSRTLDVAAWISILYMLWNRTKNTDRNCIAHLVACSQDDCGRVSSPLPYHAHCLLAKCPAEFRQVVCN